MAPGALRESLRILWLMATPGRGRAAQLYDVLSTGNNLSKAALYLNLGYWEKARDYEEACADLARLLAKSGGMGPKDEVLDVGFGFADQDMLWAAEFRPKRITGLNITASQVEVARRRVSEKGLSGSIELRHGSATAMPFAAASFDLVTALETAFHYDTREDFFREAFRVLRPGGRLATADILPLEGELPGWKARLIDRAARAFWQIPAANMYPSSVYLEKLGKIGFRDVACRSIREQVYEPFALSARERLKDPEVAGRLNPFVRAVWRASVRAGDIPWGVDYVIATAAKP